MQLLGIDILFEGINMQRLLGGLWVTVRIAIISVVLSMFFGALIGILASSKNTILKIACKLYLECVRIIPLIVWLFLFYYGAARVFGVSWSGEITGIIVFTIWGSAEMSDLVRAAVTSLPLHQKQSALALGLNKYQLYIYIIVPQALRRLAPSAINLITRMIKTTPLVALITVVEVLKIGQQIIEYNVLKNPFAAFWVYGFVFFLYFIICYPISLASRKLEKKWQ
ncbi:MAG: amino acid ABC transporter permease [Campylobacteraceae bacterium]|jgi:polar amino acid transport system permease protein|nr:amino acid ABC transporter permease [Campylobacteraceae bacterium]